MIKFYSITLFILLSMFGFGLQSVSAQNQDNGIVMEKNVPEIKIKVSENRLIIENLPKDDVLEVFSIFGVKVYTQQVKSGTNEYQLNLPKGYYIVKIGTFTKKILLR